MGYMAILFSPDGEDYVTDHEHETVEQVWDAINDQGSRWFFYPLPFVVTDRPTSRRTRIVAAPDEYGFLQGRTVGTVQRVLARIADTTLAPDAIPDNFEVRPISPDDPTATDPATCGTCGLTWDDGEPTSWTPAPSGRCPFEYFHKDEDDAISEEAMAAA